jgi:hypothetical protein
MVGQRCATNIKETEKIRIESVLYGQGILWLASLSSNYVSRGDPTANSVERLV